MPADPTFYTTGAASSGKHALLVMFCRCEASSGRELLGEGTRKPISNEVDVDTSLHTWSCEAPGSLAAKTFHQAIIPRSAHKAFLHGHIDN